MREKLEKLGFSKNEAEVYLALLEIGQTTTGAIIKKLGIHRNIVYESLDKLEKRGLVTQTTISGKMNFQVVNPEKILDLEKEKLSIARELTSDLKKVQRKEKQEITVHQGIKEMGEVRRNIIKELDRGGEYSVINAVGKPFYQATKSFHKKLDAERIAKDIKQKLLVSSKDYGEVMKTLERMNVDNTKTEWKVMPSDFKSPASILTYLDKVIFQIIPEDNPEDPTLITIKNKDLAESYKNYFEMLWNQEVEIFKGVDGIFTVFNKMLGELEKGDEYYVLGANWGWQREDIFKFFTEFHTKRIEKGVVGNLLFISGSEKILDKYKDNYKKANIKFLPSGIYDGIQINLYKNKVAIIVWREDEPISFLLDDEKIYKTFKTYFDALWDQKVEIYKGRKAIEIGDKEMLSTGELCAMGMGRKMTNKIFPDLSKKNKQDRDAKKVKARYLVSGMTEKDKWFYQGPTTEYKVLPKEYFSPVTTITHGNKVSFWVWSGDEPTVTIIEDKNLAESQRKYFDVLWQQESRVYRGLDGIKAMFNEALDSEDIKDLYVIGGTWSIKKLMPDFYKEWDKRRVAKKIRWHDLVDYGIDKKLLKTADELYEYKILSKDLKSPNVIFFYGNNLVNILWNGESSSAFLLENEEVVESYKNYFDLLWGQKTRQYRGKEGISELIEEFAREGKDLYLLGSTGILPKRYPDLYKKFEGHRKQKGLKRHDLSVESVRGTDYTKAQNIEIKYLPDEFASPTVTWIFGNKFVNVVWLDEEVASVIEDQGLVDSFMKRFNYLWSIAKD